MQIHEYISKYDNLISEERLFQIPLRKEYILNQVGSGKTVLDVGCLGGQISKMIMDRHNRVFAVEVNPRAAEAARKLGIPVQVANVEEGLPFEDEFFDVVNAGELVDHLYDTKHFFLECYRVLKKNGVFLFTTPNLNSLENRLRMMAGQYLDMVGAYPEDSFGDHIRFFNISKIEELCLQTGFQVEDVRGIFYLKSKGKWMDFPFNLAGRIAPGFSKLLIVKVRKAQISS